MSNANLITFHVYEVRRSVSLVEALILSDWLHKTRVLVAGPLAKRLDSEIQAKDRQGIELDADSSVVLRDLLTDTDLGQYGGLKGLAQALRSATWNEPVEDG